MASASPRSALLDFLKTISSHPKLKASRDNRWEYLGLVNEPCFVKADRSGSEAVTACGSISGPPIARPTRSKTSRNIPASPSAARGKTMEKGSYYGAATGIVGLRLFPNPDFDERAAQAWNAERFYTDPGLLQVEHG